jgi:hypothetical protein
MYATSGLYRAAAWQAFDESEEHAANGSDPSKKVRGIAAAEHLRLDGDDQVMLGLRGRAGGHVKVADRFGPRPLAATLGDRGTD